MKDQSRPFEKKKCPRCGNSFTCSTSAKCWCFEVDIPAETIEIIQDTWSGCLCPKCLKSFAKQG